MSNRKVDRQLAQMMVDYEPFIRQNEALLNALFRLWRGQALEDSADYLVRMSNSVADNMRKNGAPPSFVKEVRKLLTNCAGEIRCQGQTANELVDQMLTAMKDPGSLTAPEAIGPSIQEALRSIRKDPK